MVLKSLSCVLTETKAPIILTINEVKFLLSIMLGLLMAEAIINVSQRASLHWILVRKCISGNDLLNEHTSDLKILR